MKILILGITVNLFFLLGCSQQNETFDVQKMQVFADFLNNEGDLFEISIPHSYSIKRGNGGGWGMPIRKSVTPDCS